MASLIGKKVKKAFDGNDFEGKVEDYDAEDPSYPYMIKFDDGDQEDILISELREILVDELTEAEKKDLDELEEKCKKELEKAPPAARGRKKKEPTEKKTPVKRASRAKSTPKKEATPKSTGKKRGRPRKSESEPAAKKAKKTPTKSPARKSVARPKSAKAATPKKEVVVKKEIIKEVLDTTITRKANDTTDWLYSKSVTYGGVVYVAGQIAKDTTDETVKGQTTQVLKQVEEILEDAGTSKARLLKVTVFLADITKFAEFNEAWNEWADKDNLPIRATVEGKLAKPECVVEVVAEAAVKA